MTRQRGGTGWRVVAVALLLSACGCKRKGADAQDAGAAVKDDDAALEQRFVSAPGAGRQLPSEPWDLPRIATRGTLRVLVEGDQAAFLARRGTPLGRERDLAEAFAIEQGLEAELILVDRFEDLLPMLQAGKGDLVAAELTVTPERQAEVAFAFPWQTVQEVLVGRRGTSGLPRDTEALAGREVHVRAGSSYAQTLDGLKAKGVALRRVDAPAGEEPETTAWRVGRGEIPLTVLDSHLLDAISAFNPDVEGLLTLAEGRQISWAVRKDAQELLTALNRFVTRRALTGHQEERFTGDLEGIKKRGVLRMLTRNNAASYFIHRGQPFGFEYELMKMVADELGVRLQVIVPPSREALVPWLLEGRGDVIAASLTITPERRKELAFTRPYLFSEELLVHKRGAKVARLEDLAGRTVHVRASSSYHQTLKGLLDQGARFTLAAAPEELEFEELVDKVAAGEFELTVMDSHLLAVEQAWRDDVEAAFPLGAEDSKREIAFALRPGAKKLQEHLDAFISREYRGLRYNMARKRYFENAGRIASVREERLGKSGRISPYDELLKKYATRYGLDWRLLAAVAYQESRFDPDAQSWVGAQGLFQVMPATGKSLGFTRLTDPEEGIHAGTMYLARLIRNLDPKIPFKHRVRFALAAYNAGIGHVADARRIALEQGWNPDRWFGHVEKAMLLLQQPKYYQRARYGHCRGSEPVKYVSEIQLRYDHYVTLVR
jgi:membrane-bound lytic murein transglycosylase F